MVSVYKTKLEIKAFPAKFSPIFIQYDHARLEIELLDEGKPHDLTKAARVEFTHVRKDGLVIIEPGELVASNGTFLVCYEYKGSEMDLIGKVRASAAIFDIDGNKTSTHSFEVTITEDLRNEIFNPAEPNAGLLQELLSEIQYVKDNPGPPGIQGPPGRTIAKVFKGSCTFAQLSAIANAQNNDYWYVSDRNTNYCYNGSEWIDVGNTLKIDDNTIDPRQTTFIEMSKNIIDPAKVVQGSVLGYTYNVDRVDDKTAAADGIIYEEIFPSVVGDIFYSNSPGRLVWYGDDDFAKGNTPFAIDAATDLYKATVGGGVKSKIEGRASNVNVDTGYWFAIKGPYDGVKSPYNQAILKDDIGSKIFASKTELANLFDIVDDLRNLTETSTFFLPANLYCYESNRNSKWIPKYNVLASRNAEQFYLDNTAPNGALRSRDKLKIQGADQVKVKKSTQLQSNPDSVFTKTYAARIVNPTTKTNPTTVKNVLMIGDSLMDAGYLPCDVKRQITVQHGFSNFNFIGTKSDTVEGVTALSEGNGGFALADYIKTNNTQGRGTTFPNPFLNNGVVSFSDYMTRNNFSGNIDYVVIELGVNDMIMLGGNPTINGASLKTLVDKILSDYPNCKIFVCGLLMLAKENDVYDHVTHNTKALNINKAYEDFCNSAAYLNKCIYVDVAVFFDTEYGYPIDTTPYRGGTMPRKVVIDWLHPNPAGYYMMADTVASAFIYHM